MHDRAVAAAGDLAEQGRDRLDLLVGVLVDLVGLDERIDDEQSDAAWVDVLDAGIDVRQPDDVPARSALATSSGRSAPLLRASRPFICRWDVPVLQDGGEPSPSSSRSSSLL